jgi:hypothetical protein
MLMPMQVIIAGRSIRGGKLMRNVLIVGALLLTTANRPPTEAEIGPAPAFADAVAITEQAIRARLTDPGSAHFEWPYDLTAGTLKARVGHRHVGWITCGLVNFRDRTGAYTGRTYFQVVLHNGSVEMLDLGTADAFGSDIAGASCEMLIKSNFLHAAPTAPAPAASAALIASPPAFTPAPAPAGEGDYGLKLMGSPMGAIIVDVAAGSRGASAGLRAGETIEAINGASVKGLDANTAGALMRAQSAGVTLTIIGVGDVAISSLSGNGPAHPAPIARHAAQPKKRSPVGVHCLSCP